ncbi:MAG: FMN-binding protein [Xanthomonadales bacterium]|jgi:hypothetical protein|nr:FMN-binding protein [Xanthomonadales bacterium]
MRITTAFRIGALCLGLVSGQAAPAAETVYQSTADFLDENLPGCERKALWLKQDAKTEIEELLDRPFPGVRVRYCGAGEKTAWILDEIGKTEPITSGVVVNGGRLERLRVLVFRESRGGEVHREAFVRQYQQAALDGKFRLDRDVDGITGATMSVNAVNRQARLALLLDRLARETSSDR